jgi:hypothetical protein
MELMRGHRQHLFLLLGALAALLAVVRTTDAQQTPPPPPCTPLPQEAFLPAFPPTFPAEMNATSVASNWTSAVNPPPPLRPKVIPRNVFVAFRNRPETPAALDEEILRFINATRHDGWNIYLFGHAEQMEFMERYYANTSLLWAIQLIGPSAGASVSDIWRVAVLYAFGGMYIDDDSFWDPAHTPLERFIGEKDALILATEPGAYRDNCYSDAHAFHLSTPALRNLSASVKGPGAPPFVFNDYWRGRRFAQFAFFSKPQHPVLGRILTNLVEQIRLEYAEQSPVFRRPGDQRWKIVVCATGPDLWTTTMYEMAVNNTLVDTRVVEKSFSEHGCTFKISEAIHVRARQSTHYYGMKEAFLRSYHKICPAEFEGQVIHHPGAHGSYFLVRNGSKRAIPSLDKMKVPMETTHFITDVDNFNAIPVGEPRPAVVP